MKIIAPLTLLAAAVAVASPAAAAEKPSAEKFYAGKCASCHGKDGRGNAKMLKMFKVEAKDLDLLDGAGTPEEDAAFVKAILEGKGKKMPSFKAKLGGLDPADLVAYIHGLKPAVK
ncbi:MAG: c-type cytochrome [Elusimicrobia bacterium]|nr:c-type cytochrome [Elusimicrobiota bacterium]